MAKWREHAQKHEQFQAYMQAKVRDTEEELQRLRDKYEPQSRRFSSPEKQARQIEQLQRLISSLQNENSQQRHQIDSLKVQKVEANAKLQQLTQNSQARRRSNTGQRFGSIAAEDLWAEPMQTLTPGNDVP